jgi:hypothetical protein
MTCRRPGPLRRPRRRLRGPDRVPGSAWCTSCCSGGHPACRPRRNSPAPSRSCSSPATTRPRPPRRSPRSSGTWPAGTHAADSSTVLTP